jgi:hypothetical protein
MPEPGTSLLVSVKTNGTGSIRQFAQKATRLKLPSGLLALGTAKERWNRPCSPTLSVIELKEDAPMMKIAFVAAAALAVLTTAPLTIPVKAQGVDVQIGRDRYDRYDRDRGRDGATVGIGPGGVTVGPRQRCRMVTTTIERGDRTITRRERRCD